MQTPSWIVSQTMVTLIIVGLLCGAATLTGQTLSGGSVGSIDANGNVAFALTFDRAPDFKSVDSGNRHATEFQFYIGTGPVPPTNTTRPMASLIRGGAINVSGAITINNATHPIPIPRVAAGAAFARG